MADYDDLVEQVKECYKFASEAEYLQREREREDLEFQIPENQWTPAARKERAGNEFQPARPMLSVSLLKQPMQLVYNQFTRARLGVFIHPVSEKANKENAEIKQGLYRRIERDGGAQQARGWAFLRALAAGRGWYRVTTKDDEDSDETWDQEIVFDRILNQENVYMDPAAQKADFSDAKWALVVGWYDYKDFKQQFPNSQAAKSDSPLMLDALTREAPGWVRASEGTKEPAFLVAEYWYKEIEREEQVSRDGLRKRVRENVSVYVAKVNGFEVLEEPVLWNGKYIPLIPVIGEELIPINGQRVWQGMIRPARDAQMAYNYAISSAVEDISRVSKTPYVGVVGSFETDRAKWDTLNIRNYPYVEYDPKGVDGQPAPPPQPFPIDGTKLQLSVQMADQFEGMVRASTAVHEPSLGDLPKRKDAQSGRAILALQQQSDAGTSQFSQNLTDITLPYESLVVLDLMKPIYDRPGRITSIVTGEDENEAVMLGVPFVTDPNTGKPTPAPQDPSARVANLADGKYGISVSFGKSPQTRLEAGQQFMAEMAQAYPPLMEVAGDLFFKFRDEPGAKEISDRLRKMIASRNPTLIEDGKNTAEQAQAENQALKQQLQVLSQQMQQAVQIIETKQVEQQAKIQVEQIKADADLKMQELRNVGAITVAQIQAEAKGAQEQTKARNEAAATGLEVVHEERMQDKEHAHEVAMASAGANTMTRSVNRGEEGEREDSREESGGQSRENSEEDQPPQQAGV